MVSVIMKIVAVAFILFIWIAQASPKTLQKHRTLKSIPAVDALIQRLEGEEWADDEACFKETLRILHGVKNDTLWATWVWDSMQLPSGVLYGTGVHLGSFDQCITNRWSSQEFSTQYCLVEVKVQNTKEPREFGAYDSAEEYMNTLSKNKRIFNHLVFGVCMPAVCSPSSVAKYTRHTLQLTYIPDPGSIVVAPSECQTAEPKPYARKTYVYLSVLGVLFLLVVVSTIYSTYNESNEYSRGTVDEIAKSFSMVHNWNELFKVNKNEIRILNGMRVITASIVISCHQALLSLFVPTMMNNSVEVDELFKDEIGQGLTHLDLIVDTFFSISGLLLIRGLLTGRQKNLFIVLLKRYFRLIGPYAATTFYIICMAGNTGSGPIWLRANSIEEGVCEKYWWKNFLMLNYDMSTMCYGVAWYVTCDFHLAILTVVLFWIYRRNKKAGMVAFGATTGFLTVRLTVNAYKNQWPLALYLYVSDVANIRNYKLMNELYIRWHDRAGSYLVGVAMGWLMNVYKPADHRNIISKTKSFTIALVSLFVMMKIASISYWFGDAGRVPVAVALATHRAVWAMAICALIAACEYGSVPIINDFLGSAIFVPISKLCYGIYMTHFFLMQRSLYVARSSLYFDCFNVLVNVMGIFTLAGSAALVLHLLVEAPCINISNLCLSGRKEKADLNVKTENGSISDGTNGITKVKAL